MGDSSANISYIFRQGISNIGCNTAPCDTFFFVNSDLSGPEQFANWSYWVYDQLNSLYPSVVSIYNNSVSFYVPPYPYVLYGQSGNCSDFGFLETTDNNNSWGAAFAQFLCQNLTYYDFDPAARPSNGNPFPKQAIIAVCATLLGCCLLLACMYHHRSKKNTATAEEGHSEALVPKA